MTPSAARFRPFASAFGFAAALLAAAPGVAQYKIVGPDGKVTYTDRQPSAVEGRVVPLGARARVEQAPEPELPFELRPVVGRYPVTLYTVVGACEPCSLGRTLLRQRGIPHTEKQVVSQPDSDALEKLSGGRETPVVMIGTQMLRGYAPDVWGSYLDAAGYPKTSRLPSAYAWRLASPIVEQAQPTAQAAAPATRAAQPAAPGNTPATATPSGTAGIRF